MFKILLCGPEEERTLSSCTPYDNAFLPVVESGPLIQVRAPVDMNETC